MPRYHEPRSFGVPRINSARIADVTRIAYARSSFKLKISRRSVTSVSDSSGSREQFLGRERRNVLQPRRESPGFPAWPSRVFRETARGLSSISFSPDAQT